MKIWPCLLLVLSGLSTDHTLAQDNIPPQLTGIWADEGAVFSDELALFEGTAIYLRSDGSGMMIGGPPPIGFRFQARYDADNKTIRIRYRFQTDGPCRDSVIRYDPGTAKLQSDVEFKRRVEQLPPAWSAELDRRPSTCSITER